jgi:hypothetical protein
MLVHRFAVGEIVLYARPTLPDLTWKTPCLIAGCLSTPGPEPHYRVQPLDGGLARTAGEHELRRGPEPIPAAGPSYAVLTGPLAVDRAANLNLAHGPGVPRPAEPRLPHAAHAQRRLTWPC